MKHHIFISYSRRDAAIMRRLSNSLTDEGLTVWTDENLTPGTQSWKMAIEDAIENAGCLVVLMSPDSKESEWVGRELDYAIAQGLRIFPVMVRGSERNAVPLTLISTQFSDLRQDYAHGLNVLLNGVCSHLGIPRVQRRADQPIPHGALPSTSRRGGGIVAGLAVTAAVLLIAAALFVLPGLRTGEVTGTPTDTPATASSPASVVPTTITLVSGSTATPVPALNSERVLGPACDALVEEEFSGGTAAAPWFEGSTANSTAAIIEGFYQIVIADNTSNSDAVSWGSLQEMRFDDARVEAVVQAAQFSETAQTRTGLWLRYQDQNNFLAFMISSSGMVRITRYQRGHTDLVPWRRASSVRVGDSISNTLRIDSRGSGFAFYVNGELVANADDATWPDGRIAFWGATNLAENRFYLDYLRVCPH